MDASENIKLSEKRLNKLRVITNFFDHADVTNISIKTKIIHDIFASNQALDSMKLELFHLQYTDSFLQLLQQLKKKIEQNYLLIENEIKANETFIASYKTEINQDNFREDIINCNVNIQLFFEAAYEYLAFNNPDKSSYLLELHHFKNIWSSEYFRPITNEEFTALDTTKSAVFHTFNKIHIEKKLLGKLNIHRFKVKFLCGLQNSNQCFSVFEFIHANEHFIFNHQSNHFQLIDLKKFNSINFTRNSSNKQLIINTLTEKIVALNNKSNTSLRQIPQDVLLVLQEYYSKISALSFLDDLQNIDEQTNILKSMLNLNIK